MVRYPSTVTDDWIHPDTELIAEACYVWHPCLPMGELNGVTCYTESIDSHVNREVNQRDSQVADKDTCIRGGLH